MYQCLDFNFLNEYNQTIRSVLDFLNKSTTAKMRQDDQVQVESDLEEAFPFLKPKN